MPPIHPTTQAAEIVALRRRVEQLERRAFGGDATRSGEAGDWQDWVPILQATTTDPAYSGTGVGEWTRDTATGIVHGWGYIAFETVTDGGNAELFVICPVELGNTGQLCGTAWYRTVDEGSHDSGLVGAVTCGADATHIFRFSFNQAAAAYYSWASDLGITTGSILEFDFAYRGGDAGGAP
jgi:hypothetical protein